jgi:hypothetical protein
MITAAKLGSQIIMCGSEFQFLTKVNFQIATRVPLFCNLIKFEHMSHSHLCVILGKQRKEKRLSLKCVKVGGHDFIYPCVGLRDCYLVTVLSILVNGWHYRRLSTSAAGCNKCALFISPSHLFMVP